jgi:hypothetical protein
MKVVTSCKRLLAAALMLVAGLAQAQYVWIDEKGIKQFSDRSPPSSIPDKNILKAPGRQAVAIALDDMEAQEPAPTTETAKKAPPTVAERNVDFNKRAGEQAEAERKLAAEAKAKAAKAEHCANARQYKAQLDSGVRMGTMTKNGETGIMGDAERAATNAKVAKALANCR